MKAFLCPGSAGPDAVAAMRRRLARLAVTDVTVLDPAPAAEQVARIAAGLEGRTLVVDADLIVAEASLGQLVDDPAVRSGALVAAVPTGQRPEVPHGSAVPVRVTHKRIASAGSAIHRVTSPTGDCLGAVVVDAQQVEPARGALADVAAVARAGGWDADPVDLVLVGLVRAQVPVGAVLAVGPVLRGGTSQQRDDVQAELDGIDEARVLLERANRPDDGFYSTFVLRRASKPVTALALRLGWSPNRISLLSLVVGLAAAVCFSVGSWPWLLAGALLMQASLVIDCVDGEVARFTRSFSDLGAWIDASTDRVKEYAAYAGLAVGSARTGTDIWLLAVVVMIMQTIRHIGDYDFSRVQRIRESWVPARSVADPADGGAAGSGATLELSAQLNRSSRIRWAKKVVHLPIGERWLILSVGAVTIGARLTLALLLLLGLVALAYTTVGRVLRARSWHHPADRSGDWLLVPQLDLGPLGQSAWDRVLAPRAPLAHAFGWAWPAGMRLVELAVVWLAAARLVPASGAWLFAWVFVVVFHHYDSLYRALGGSAPPRWLVTAGLGWDGRTLAVLLAAVLGSSALLGLLTWGSVLLGILFVVLASVQWIRSMTREDGSHV